MMCVKIFGKEVQIYDMYFSKIQSTFKVYIHHRFEVKRKAYFLTFGVCLSYIEAKNSGGRMAALDEPTCLLLCSIVFFVTRWCGKEFLMAAEKLITEVLWYIEGSCYVSSQRMDNFNVLPHGLPWCPS